MSVGVKGGTPFTSPLTPTGSCATHLCAVQYFSYNNLTPSGNTAGLTDKIIFGRLNEEEEPDHRFCLYARFLTTMDFAEEGTSW
jgi:hypothetical protein